MRLFVPTAVEQGISYYVPTLHYSPLVITSLTSHSMYVCMYACMHACNTYIVIATSCKKNAISSGLMTIAEFPFSEIIPKIVQKLLYLFE